MFSKARLIYYMKQFIQNHKHYVRNGLLIYLLLWLNQFSFSQSELIPAKNIDALNQKIDSLEIVYNHTPKINIASLNQGIGDYFELKTKSPETFISELIFGKKLESLISGFPNLQIDRNLLLLRNDYKYSNGTHKLEIQSFEIKNNGSHRITIDYSDSLVFNKIKFYYSAYTDKKSQVTSLRGFLIKEDFSQIKLPKKYADWVLYTDVLVIPEENLFYSKKDLAQRLYIQPKSVVDSLVNYYAIKTNKPKYFEGAILENLMKQLDSWEEKRPFYTDSLFRQDSDFKKLLHEALGYAENKQESNGELEYFTAALISKTRALRLMRFNKQVGTCSFDNGPVNQQKRMAALAAQIPDWNVFIKSFLNVMNDNVSRIANNSMAVNARETYIEELSMLKLDISKLLLGSNMRIDNTEKPHYFSDGGKIGKAFSLMDLDQQAKFERTIEGIIRDEKVDAFNKLHFYNTFVAYQYHLEDSVKKSQIGIKIKALEDYMPIVLKSRLKNPDKELQDLLFTEKDEMDDFEILDSSVGSIYSYTYGGDCWMAELREKNKNSRIIFDLTMPIEDSITPLRNFITQKEELISRVTNHSFLNNLLNTNKENLLYIYFTGDRSFLNFRNQIIGDMPKELQELDYHNAISFYISYPDRKYVRYIMLENNNIILLGVPEDYTIPGYSFQELVTETEEILFSKFYKSYKVFDEKGKMLN